MHLDECLYTGLTYLITHMQIYIYIIDSVIIGSDIMMMCYFFRQAITWH